MRRICWLDSRGARRRAVAGGKGAALAALRAGGRRVPDAFIVTTRGFKEFCAAAGVDPLRALLDDRARDEARVRLASQPFPAALAAAVTSAARRLGGPVAVRSSLAEEDGTERSFAGQLESVLNVDAPGGCLEAARQVYASAFAPSLAAYALNRAAAGTTAKPPRLAVVVQRMIEPRAAGVAFSADPVTGQRRVVIEATTGLADSLLRGTVVPARFVVENARSPIAADRRDVTPERLPDTVVAGLASLVRALAGDAGLDQDVEWAWDGTSLWLLQARPITARGGSHLYSRRLVGDMSPGQIRPLLWSTHCRSMTRRVFGRLFTELLGPTDTDFTALIRRFHSRMYADMTMFGDLLARAGLPRNFFETVARQEHAARRPPVTWRLVARLPRVSWFVWRYARAAPDIERFLERHERELAPLRAADWRGDDLQGLLEKVERLIEMHGESQWHTFVGAMNMAVRNRLLEQLLSRCAPGVGAAELTRGLGGLKGLEPNEALRRLAGDAAWSAAAPPALLATGDDAAIRAALASTDAGRQLGSQVDAFLERFGYLAGNGTDFTEPRWAEEPGPVWQAIARHLQTAGARQLEQRDAELACAGRDQSRADVRSRLRPLTRWWFDVLVQSTTDYMQRRERLSAAMTEDAYQARRLFLAVGDRLVAGGALAHRADVFLLYQDELKALARGRLEGADHLAARRAADLAADAAIEPEESFYGHHPAPEERHAAPHEVLAGIPGSPGVVAGYARVVLDPAAAPASLSRDDVLVVPYTDIGWSPLLAAVGGVVAECGGQLSHTAIIAREYGLPTVVSVSRATRIISDGQPLTVDGTRGLVYLKHL